jgi:hypothetical protein
MGMMVFRGATFATRPLPWIHSGAQFEFEKLGFGTGEVKR